LVKREPAGLYANLIRRRNLCSGIGRILLFLLCRARARLFCRSHLRIYRPIERDFNRTVRLRYAGLLVVFKFGALNPVGPTTSRIIHFNLHYVQPITLVLELFNLGRGDLELRMTRVKLSVREAVCLLLYINAKLLGQIASVERTSPPANGQEHAESDHQQHTRHQHHRSYPFNGEAHALIPHAEPGRQALRKALSQFAPQNARSGPGTFL